MASQIKDIMEAMSGIKAWMTVIEVIDHEVWEQIGLLIQIGPEAGVVRSAGKVSPEAVPIQRFAPGLPVPPVVVAQYRGQKIPRVPPGDQQALPSNEAVAMEAVALRVREHEVVEISKWIPVTAR